MLNEAGIWKGLNSSDKLTLIAGPCVIESDEVCLRVAKTLKKICDRLGIHYIFKASYDKANRTSIGSYRGPGLEEGLEILAAVRKEVDVPVLTDVHTPEQAAAVAKVVDVLQVPAFLCRQTDLVLAVAATGKIVNLKKGQFLSPNEMSWVVEKARGGGASRIVLTERGTTFGYNNLVADMRAIPMMLRLGCPVIFDATHSVQTPGIGGDSTGGQRAFAPVLARASVAAGANGVFIETHPDPEQALSDGPNSIPLREMNGLLERLTALKAAMR